MSRPASWIVALTCCLTLAGPLLTAPEVAAGPRKDARVVRRVLNAERRARDIRALRRGARASRVALRNSRRMARHREVFHPRNMPGAIEDLRWTTWGDNVVCARSLKQAHRKVMSSRRSRRNVLNRRFRVVGIGVARSTPRARACRGATYWITQIFYG